MIVVRVAQVAAAVALLPALAQAQAELKSQPACAPGSFGECLQFSAASPPPEIIRSLRYRPPQDGSVLVVFNGSGYCGKSSGASPGVLGVTFQTQIVRGNAQPSGGGPGGVYVSMQVPEFNALYPSAVPFNLSSSRVFPVVAENRQTYHVKISTFPLPGGVTCFLYADTLSALFIPG
jgi:hypothetical protein